MLTIQSLWDSYHQQVLPKDAGPTQIQETKQAFYGGAATIFNLVGQISDNENEQTAIAMLDTLQQECEQFILNIGG